MMESDIKTVMILAILSIVFLGWFFISGYTFNKRCIDSGGSIDKNSDWGYCKCDLEYRFEEDCNKVYNHTITKAKEIK